jgi:hypothetical protein
MLEELKRNVHGPPCELLGVVSQVGRFAME